MGYMILDADKDTKTWEKTLDLLPKRIKDIYYYPQYLNMHRFIKNSKSLMFVYQKNKSIWVHPFIYQPIDLDQYYIEGGPWFDLESVYGYSGPLSNTNNSEFLAEANDQFNAWCNNNYVVAEFIRFHPLYENQKWVVDPKTKVEYDRMTIAKDLHNFDSFNLPFHGKVRNLIKRVHKEKID